MQNSEPESSKPTESKIVLEIIGQQVPAFKNSKRSILDSQTGLQRTLTPKKMKLRMDRLENAMLSALYSESQIIGNETHSECWKRLRTALCGLLDDSIREIPRGEWDVEYVAKGKEGARIEITRL